MYGTFLKFCPPLSSTFGNTILAGTSEKIGNVFNHDILEFRIIKKCGVIYLHFMSNFYRISCRIFIVFHAVAFYGTTQLIRK